MSATEPSTSDAASDRGPGGLESVADALSRLARDLEDESDLQATLDAIVHAAVGTVPGAQHASISMVRARRHVSTRAATSELARKNDQAQLDAGEGPCLDTLYEKRTALVPDTAQETRWPNFASTAHERGIGSVLSVQLYVHGDDLGALNLVNEEPHAFDDESEHVALLFAAHSAIAIVGAQKEEQLRVALDRRDIIGQAMGITMERYGLTAQRAFSLLTRLSQHSNRKLHELAAEIVHTRAMPSTPQEPSS